MNCVSIKKEISAFFVDEVSFYLESTEQAPKYFLAHRSLIE